MNERMSEWTNGWTLVLWDLGIQKQTEGQWVFLPFIHAFTGGNSHLWVDHPVHLSLVPSVMKSAVLPRVMTLGIQPAARVVAVKTNIYATYNYHYNELIFQTL